MAANFISVQEVDLSFDYTELFCLMPSESVNPSTVNGNVCLYKWNHREPLFVSLFFVFIAVENILPDSKFVCTKFVYTNFAPNVFARLLTFILEEHPQ